MGQLSILEPIPIEDLKENTCSNLDVQNEILGQLSRLEPDVFEKSTEINKKSTADEKPFGCEYCDKRFKFYLIARHHEKIHTGEKPFACNICDFKSTRSSSLTKHVKIHGITNNLTSTQGAVKPKIHEKVVRTPYQTNVSIDCDIGVNKELNQLSDQILNSSRYEKSKYQKAILEQLSSLEPVALEKSNELNRKSTNFQQKVAKTPDQTNTPIDANIGKYACKYCDNKYAHLNSLKVHERIHTGKNLMAAATVKRNLPDQQLLGHMKGLNLGKNHMAVNTVIRNLLHYNLLNHMKGLTLEKNPIPVNIVTRSLLHYIA